MAAPSPIPQIKHTKVIVERVCLPIPFTYPKDIQVIIIFRIIEYRIAKGFNMGQDRGKHYFFFFLGLTFFGFFGFGGRPFLLPYVPGPHGILPPHFKSSRCRPVSCVCELAGCEREYVSAKMQIKITNPPGTVRANSSPQ